LQERFAEHESRPWSIEAYVVELLAEAGTLADLIMIRENYRQLRPNQRMDLEDGICDILFIVIAIASHYGVSIENAYASMLSETFAKLDQRPKPTG
jgi:NTP pyrophosphatase (non-canonical NTP hydrolase)